MKVQLKQKHQCLGFIVFSHLLTLKLNIPHRCDEDCSLSSHQLG